jgi:hypothetical protein
MSKTTTKGRPVSEIDIEFEWQTSVVPLIDKQITLIQQDVRRAFDGHKVIVYLSCPISSRGGGYSGTNVDIALHTERRLLEEWGERFWILNPCRYQMESGEGANLLQRHVGGTKIKRSDIKGGDYMRMWTRVLCEDAIVDRGKESQADLKNSGRCFDAFYFLGPSDVRDFFIRPGPQTLTAGVEEYFARRYATDHEFMRFYSPKKQAEWESRRRAFFVFYAIRASANYSLGSHDEWNILRLLNRRRLAASQKTGMLAGDVGEQIAGFFDGRQIDPAAFHLPATQGYAM